MAFPSIRTPCACQQSEPTPEIATTVRRFVLKRFTRLVRLRHQLLAQRVDTPGAALPRRILPRNPIHRRGSESIARRRSARGEPAIAIQESYRRLSLTTGATRKMCLPFSWFLVSRASPLREDPSTNIAEHPRVTRALHSLDRYGPPGCNAGVTSTGFHVIIPIANPE